jgi:hypothetical protein
MESIILLVPDVQGYSVTIDGITYRTLRRDANDRLLVATEGPYTPTNVYAGQVAVPGVLPAQQLPNIPIKAASIEAFAANALPVYIGPAGITVATARELAPGATIDVALTNLNQLYVIAAAVGNVISYLAVL